MHQFAGGWQTKEQQLLEAAKAQQVNRVQQLLRLKADPTWCDEKGCTALHAACQQKLHGAEMAKLLLQYGASADAADVDGWRPLHWAAFYNGEEAIRVLTQHADVNARTRRNETPLHWACRNDAARAVKALAASPSLDLESTCLEHESPMHWAQRNDAENALRELRKAHKAREGTRVSQHLIRG
mmetsp:Transcript_28755/g.60452  ORF Transcript_28755/g.60452 Transcript_28755/m.60452 type:complete len:184 (+) Transcript_28755:236-787(+)